MTALIVPVLSYIWFLYLKNISWRGFIDSVYNPSRHPSPIPFLYSSVSFPLPFHPSFHSHTSFHSHSPSSFFPSFFPSFISFLKPQTRREDVVRRDLGVDGEKKGRDHQLADGGMQKRYRLEGSSIGLLSPPSPLPSLCASHQPPLFLCQGGMTCWITKQPSHVSACSLCQPRDKRYQAPGALMRATERRRRRTGGKKKEMSKEESEWESE